MSYRPGPSTSQYNFTASLESRHRRVPAPGRSLPSERPLTGQAANYRSWPFSDARDCPLLPRLTGSNGYESSHRTRESILPAHLSPRMLANG